MFVDGFSTGVQHVISIMSMGFLIVKTLSGVLVAYIVCIGGHRNGSFVTLNIINIMLMYFTGATEVWGG